MIATNIDGGLPLTYTIAVCCFYYMFILTLTFSYPD
jgi:hypothetical protein